MQGVGGGKFNCHDPQTVARSHHLRTDFPTLSNTADHQLAVLSGRPRDDIDRFRQAVP